MPAYQLIKNGVVVNTIIADPAQIDLIRNDYDQIVEVVPEPPPPPPPAPTHRKIISPIEFKLMFTPQERIAIRAARSSDPILEDFFGIVEDPRLTMVDLDLQYTIDGINYLASQNLLTAARKTTILEGIPV